VAALEKMKVERVLPFRFVAASRFAPTLEPQLEAAMLRCLKDHARMPGKTVLLVDVSGSMNQPISEKSDLVRMDAACALAMLAREICETISVFAFSEHLMEVPARRGFALRDAIVNSMPHSSTFLGQAVDLITKKVKYDRLIIITDEQSAGALAPPAAKGYCINVANNQNGIAYGKWHHIDGFSEAVIDYIQAFEGHADAL
jgi:60 kDa SS-A/Ro ribonucleoprotein